MSLFHLALESEWKAGQRDGRYTPARFSADCFVHCCDDLPTATAIARAYYAARTEPLLLITLDEGALDVEVKREAPAPPDGKAHAHHDGRRFPHVYGSIPLRAVMKVEAFDEHG